MTTTTTPHVLDAKGLNCPLPILKVKQAIHNLASGELLQVYATDPGSVRDFAMFCRTAGHELVESGETDGVFHYLIKKA